MSEFKAYYNQAVFAEYLLIKGYSTKSREAMIKYIRYFADWCTIENLDLLKVSYNDIVAYIQACKKRGLKLNTIQARVNTVSHYYKCLIGRDEMTDNPCSNVDLKRGKRRSLYETFSPEELETMYKHYAALAQLEPGNKLTISRNRLMLSFFIYQGLRSEELARLNVTDVKMQKGSVL